MTDPLQSGGFEPIRTEYDYSNPSIDGEIPAELSGSLYRIGPNPQFVPRGRYNPLQGDGMVHAFHIRNRRVAYRNRWVRTQQWTLERTAGRALFATSGNPADADPSVAGMPTDGVANTNLIWHGGRLLALEEGHAPIELDPLSLDTRGVWTFDGRWPSSMTAHPKVDPETGEMLFFSNIPSRKLSGEIAYHVVDRDGALIRSETIQGPFAALVHDFAVTRDFVVFFVCPVTVSLKRLRAGGSPIAWEPELLTHVGVMPRAGHAGEVRWYAMEARMAWHAMNAFNDDERICIDVCEQAAPAFPSASGVMADDHLLQQRLTRWTLEIGGNVLSTQRLSEVVCEYPRFDERRAGLTYRHGYVACEGGPGTGDMFQRAIGHFDHSSRVMRTYHAGARCSVSEPIFVPRSDAAPEGVGYLLATIFDEQRNRSHLAIFDAENLAGGPIARVHLDHRIPAGFHGTWRAEPA